MPGTVVEIGRAEPEGHPLDWRISEVQTIPGLCEIFVGTLDRPKDKTFAFIRTSRDDIFVAPEMAAAFTPGTQHDVNCLAIRRTNKQGKTGWRAVKFIEQEDQWSSDDF